MKLKIFAIDFTKDSVSFKVPREVMEKATWHGGFAEVDLSEVSNIENEQSAAGDTQHCGNCGAKL